jgi:hypothetical protein
MSFNDNSRSPLEFCAEAATCISQLTLLYSKIYGLDKPLFVHAHCLTSAAMIHAWNLSSSNSTLNNSQLTENHLVFAIKGLFAMEDTYKVAFRYLKGIQTLVNTLCENVPDEVQLALDNYRYEITFSAADIGPFMTWEET